MFVPAQAINDVVRIRDGIVAEELGDFRYATQSDRRLAIFPIPNDGGCHPNLKSDVFLVQSKFKTATAQVVIEGEKFFG